MASSPFTVASSSCPAAGAFTGQFDVPEKARTVNTLRALQQFVGQGQVMTVVLPNLVKCDYSKNSQGVDAVSTLDENHGKR